MHRGYTEKHTYRKLIYQYAQGGVEWGGVGLGRVGRVEVMTRRILGVLSRKKRNTNM